MIKKVKFEHIIMNKTITIELGELAQLASGSVMVRYGDTSVLSVVSASNTRTKMNFFPLMVMFQEKLYAAGKIPGGFLKREGRPSEHATLTSRLIDRTIRPLFPNDFRNEVQVINNVLSSDSDFPSDISAILGSSLALMLSNIPFDGPIAGVNIGRINGEFVINPTVEEKEQSDLDLIVAGTKDAVNMVEASASEVPEEDILDAILFGHSVIKSLCEFQLKVVNEFKIEKMNYEKPTLNINIENEIRNKYTSEIKKILKNINKTERNKELKIFKDDLLDHYELDEEKEMISIVIDNLKKEIVRTFILNDKIRIDGRKLNQIRKLESKIDILPRTHGSALFTRGETQALSVTTLGTLGEHQIIDSLSDEDQKRFMLHYNFPQFSVGEVGRYGAPSRREIGHGALGEKALLQVMPSELEFPYTIRIVSEILASNGSTSQASICAGTMSLMAAGVPIKRPVAGIAMGLIKEGQKYSILSDIQGLEDHLGDMDFKVAGTKVGITALQMDIKIEGLNKDILKESLESARIGRMLILDNMIETISKSRVDVSKWAPKVKVINIPPNKIRDVIGTGGKVITDLIEKANDVKIDIENDGRVIIQHKDIENINIAIDLITNIIKEAKVGEIFDNAKVVRVESFGAFVNLWKGQDALLHVSQISHERVEKVEDVIKLNDLVKVQVLEIDDKGRVKVSIKTLLEKKNKEI